MAESLHTTLAKIPASISDAAIASAYNLPIERVARIRASVRRPKRVRSFVEGPPTAYDGDINRYRKNMEQGSLALLDAMQRAFAKGARG